MAVFKKHYTRDEANALLPRVRQWLAEVQQLRAVIENCEEQLNPSLALGDDLGGPIVTRYNRALSAIKEILVKFHQREIQVKDLDRGLIDFPAYIGGKEVFLCWETGEEDVEFWHDLSSGYAGREKL